MHYLYILKSKESGKYYIGETSNIIKRLKSHNLGKTSFGKRNKNLHLVFKKGFTSKCGVKKLESFLKRQKSHVFIDKFIAGKISIPL